MENKETNKEKIDQTIGWIFIIIGLAICGFAIYLFFLNPIKYILIVGGISIVLHLFVKYGIPKLEKKYLDEDGNWKEKDKS